MSYGTQDVINRLRETYPDEDLNGEFLRSTVELAKKLVTYTKFDRGEDRMTGILIVEGDTSDQEILEIARLVGIAPEGRICSCEHDCCGHWYSNALKIEDTVSTKYRYAYQYHYPNV